MRVRKDKLNRYLFDALSGCPRCGEVMTYQHCSEDSFIGDCPGCGLHTEERMIGTGRKPLMKLVRILREKP
jgi:hypothetical protein